MKTNRRRAAVGALGACVLLVSACGSGSDSTAGTTPQSVVEDSTGSADAPTTEAPPADAGATTAPPADETDGTDTEPAATDPAVVVPEALQFTAPLVGGGTFDGAAAAGKPTVFWFWAPT